MIYCVVPRPLADDLFEKLAEHYSDEPNVEVIVDRRAQGGEPGTHDSWSDRRRRRVVGTFPSIEPPAKG
jgi:hypothetical protein